MIYRVPAVNGIGAESTPQTSDGFIIDLGIPALSDPVYEGSAAVDWGYDNDGSFSVFWAEAGDTGSGITYRLGPRKQPQH